MLEGLSLFNVIDPDFTNVLVFKVLKHRSKNNKL